MPECLKSISTEANMITSIRYSFHSSSMLFTESGSFGVIVDGSFSIPSLLQNRSQDLEEISRKVFSAHFGQLSIFIHLKKKNLIESDILAIT
jgi:hypothetical protein